MSDRMKTYKTHPMSLVFNILTKIAVVLTISVFVLIVGYVVIKGVPYLKPSLFAKTYTTENVSMLSGACTLAIMVLPLVIRSTEEALKSVDDSFREGSYGLGAGKLRTIFVIVLPPAISGILSGVILAMGRIFGETAALIYTAGTIAKYAGLTDSGRTLSIHMYSLSNEGLYMNEASATAVVLLAVVLLLNGLASLVARKLSKGGN